jgi:hypothetical protein
MKPPTHVGNSAKGFSIGNSSLFKRRAMENTGRDIYDSMDTLRITPTVEDKEQETGRILENAYDQRPHSAKHRRSSIRRNSLVSKEKIAELADLTHDDDRKVERINRGEFKYNINSWCWLF